MLAHVMDGIANVALVLKVVFWPTSILKAKHSPLLSSQLAHLKQIKHCAIARFKKRVILYVLGLKEYNNIHQINRRL